MNRAVSKFLFLAVLSFSSSTWGAIDRHVQVHGMFKNMGEKISQIETETGVVNVPTAALKAWGFKPGQMVLVFVDIADILDLNQEAIDKLKPEKK